MPPVKMHLEVPEVRRKDGGSKNPVEGLSVTLDLATGRVPEGEDVWAGSTQTAPCGENRAVADKTRRGAGDVLSRSNTGDPGAPHGLETRDSRGGLRGVCKVSISTQR